MIKITRKKKNPHLEDIEYFIKNNSIDFKFISRGGEGKVFYFKLNKNLIINSNVLKSGEYALKIFDNIGYSQNNKKGLSYDKINKLLLLSKYGLIPKIFIITKKYIISKYIHGTSYDEFEYNNPKVDSRIEELLKIWKKLGFHHGDVKSDNILISNDLKHVYIIDPYIKS